MSSFTKAVRKKSKLRMGISGPSGSGKTMAALSIAKGLGGKIALIDTERGSASLYADPVRLGDGSVWTPPAFDTMDRLGRERRTRDLEEIDAAVVELAEAEHEAAIKADHAAQVKEALA